MEQTAKNSALQRKLRAGRAGQAVQAMTPARAFRLSTERAAAQDLGLRLDVLGVELRQGPVEELGADLADDGVILLLRTGAAPAALVCDLQMVSALVEVQTLGQAQARPAAPRVLTATDAALTQPLLAGVSRRMAGLLPADAAALPPLTPVKRMPDMRALVLEMGTGGYQLWRCSCALGHERCAEFALLLPAAEPPAAAQLPDRTQAAPTPAAARRAPLRPHPTCRCQPLLRMASLAMVAIPHKKGGHLRPPFGFVLCGPLLGPKGCPQRWPLAVGGHGIQRGAQLI
jgi:flagellar motor switch protein FliM